MPFVSGMLGFCLLDEIPLIRATGVLPFIGGMRPLIGDGVSRRFVDASVANEASFSRRFTVLSGHF
jgi:hypothetical protein